MLLVKAENLKKVYAERTVLEVKELLIYTGDRIGVVGRNGAGKTTLFEVLAGELEPEEGSVQRLGGISYCKQFDENAIDTISGGEEMKRKLTEVFANERHLLLLDEPTANLDREGVSRLLKQLAEVESFLCISHDRDLLNKVCNQILEVADGKIHLYPGNYEAYETRKQQERKKAESDYETYIQEKERLTAVYRQKREAAERMVKIPKNMTPKEARLRDFLTVSGRNSSGKQKSMNRSADNVKKRLEHMEVKEKPKQEAIMRLSFERTNPPESKRILEVRALSFGYGDELLLDQVSFAVSNRKKTALLGPNGIGKTTLLRLIEQAYHQGDIDAIRLSPQVCLGILKQDFSQIDPAKTVLDNALAVSVQHPTVVRSVLAGMLFGQETWNKRAEVLSGGEKMRLAFVMLFVSSANVLLLDEPTNYLDLASIQALEKQLQEYEGAVLFISHDSEFVRNTAQELLLMQDKKVTRFAGTLTDYEEEQKRMSRPQPANRDAQLSTEERMRLELQQAKLAGMLGHAPSLEEKERLEAEYWEVTRRLQNTGI